MSAAPDESSTFLPKRPGLLAAGILAIWVIVLFLPMFGGKFLGWELSDQTWTGIPFRQFWADEIHRTGHMPLWNPYMFGGLPFVGAMHGDIFYPTSFLRYFLRPDQVLNIVFLVHMYLAGLFTYLFLRRIGTTWTAAVVGGLAYQLSGIVASQVSPGHDGKMIVSALLPLLLMALVIAIRERKAWGWPFFAAVVALDLLSPQTQTTQYSLIFAGLLTLYLVFFDEARPQGNQRWIMLALAFASVLLGAGIAMVQFYPFIKYGPYAARVAGNQGWAYATQYAMPPANIVDWLTATFTGSSVWGIYWAGGFKLHSEYVGAAVLGLVALGVATPRRRFALFLGGVWLLFVLVCLGPATPFYRLWYALVPGVKVTRAPGMAFFIPTFIFAIFAAFGVERLQRKEGRGVTIGLLIAAGVVLLLGLTGGLTEVASRMAGEAYPAVDQMSGMIRLGAVLAGIALLALGGVALVAQKGRLPNGPLAVLLCLVVSIDLVVNAQRSFKWLPGAPEIYAPDSIIQHLRQTPMPYRVLDGVQAYPTAYLMYHRIPNVLGHHGNEMHAYDQLLGGKNEWRNLGLRLFDPLAVRYVITGEVQRIPGYHAVLRTQQPAFAVSRRNNAELVLYEADTTPAYARVVPAAAKVPDEQAVQLMMNPRLDLNRVALLPDTASVNPPPVDTLPPASASRATVTHWEPGAMTIHVDPAPTADSWLVISENWYKEWKATIDGRAATPLRGDASFLTLALPRGAKDVQLSFGRDDYNKGRLITVVSLVLLAAWFAVPVALRRRSA